MILPRNSDSCLSYSLLRALSAVPLCLGDACSRVCMIRCQVCRFLDLDHVLVIRPRLPAWSLNIILFLYLWLCWVFIAVWTFLSWRRGVLWRCYVQASLCCGAGALGAGFSWDSWPLECWLSSCGLGARLLVRGILGPGIKPLSPALAGEFFTTEPPGKPLLIFTDLNISQWCSRIF